jgi:hypothetical protein
MDLFTEHGARSERAALDALTRQANALGPHVAAGRAKRRGRVRRSDRARLRLSATGWLRHAPLDAGHRTTQAT